MLTVTPPALIFLRALRFRFRRKNLLRRERFITASKPYRARFAEHP